jgi:DHA2 family multidrug resistance protein
MTAAAPNTALTPGERIAVVVGILPASMMPGMDTFAVAVALPRMQGVFSATPTEISWVLTAYLVAAAIFTPLYGWLSLRFNRRILFSLIIVGYAGCALLIAQSDSLQEVVLFRFAQGFFGAGFNPLLMQTVLATFPREQQGTAFGWFTTGRMSGTIVGPVLGGVLTEFFSWRFVFLINVPLAALALVLIMRYVPAGHAESSKRFDFLGFIMLSVGIGALQLVLDQGQRLDWFDSSFIIVLGAIALLAFYLFGAHVLTSENAYLNPSVFRNRDFVIGLFFGFLLSFMIFGYAGLIPPILQHHMGYPIVTTGLVMLPRGIGTILASLLAGAMLIRYPPRPVAALGIVMIALSTWLMSHFTPEVDVNSVMLAITFQGAGFGFLSVAIMTLSFQSLPAALHADGTSVLSLFRRMGASIGVSVLITMLARTTQSTRAALIENVNIYDERFRNLALPASWDVHTAQGMQRLNALIDKQAEFISYLHDFMLMTVLMLCLLPLLLLMKSPTRSGS